MKEKKDGLRWTGWHPTVSKYRDYSMSDGQIGRTK
jgi:hypothetical protein